MSSEYMNANRTHRTPTGGEKHASAGKASGAGMRATSSLHDEMEGKGAAPGDHDLGSIPVQRKKGSRENDGEHLPSALRRKMERSLGHDFSGVRIHQGLEAERIGAMAFTQGNHIHLKPGMLGAQPRERDMLLGHELAHVVQQRRGGVASSSAARPKINTDASLEAEADLAGVAAAHGASAAVQGSTSSGSIQMVMSAAQMHRMRTLEQALYSSRKPPNLRSLMVAMKAELMGADDYNTDIHAKASVEKIDRWLLSSLLPSESSGSVQTTSGTGSTSLSSGTPSGSVSTGGSQTQLTTTSSGGGGSSSSGDRSRPVVHSTSSSSGGSTLRPSPSSTIGVSTSTSTQPRSLSIGPSQRPTSLSSQSSGGTPTSSMTPSSMPPSMVTTTTTPTSRPLLSSPSPLSLSSGGSGSSSSSPPQTLFTSEVREPRTQRMVEPRKAPKDYAWDAQFNVAVSTTAKTITVTIRLDTTASDQTLRNWNDDTNNKWSNRFQMRVPVDHGAKRGAYRIHVNLTRATRSSSTGRSNAHFSVTPVDHTLPGFAGARGLHGTSNMRDWGVHDRTDVPHEVGHMLGNLDEYYTVNGHQFTGPTEPARSGVDMDEGSIMNDPRNNPLPQHYDLIVEKAAEALGVPRGDVALEPAEAGGGQMSRSSSSSGSLLSSRTASALPGMGDDMSAARSRLRRVEKTPEADPSGTTTTTLSSSSGSGGGLGPSSLMHSPSLHSPSSTTRTPSRTTSLSSGGSLSGGTTSGLSSTPRPVSTALPLTLSGGSGSSTSSSGPRPLPTPGSVRPLTLSTGGSGSQTSTLTSGSGGQSLPTTTRPSSTTLSSLTSHGGGSSSTVSGPSGGPRHTGTLRTTGGSGLSSSIGTSGNSSSPSGSGSTRPSGVRLSSTTVSTASPTSGSSSSRTGGTSSTASGANPELAALLARRRDLNKEKDPNDDTG